MSQVTNAGDLPLLSRTPDSWAGAVIRDVLALLNDWVSTLAAIASDEAAHLSSVVRLLNRRGGRLERMHRNPHANALRALVRKGRGNEELADRLLISALIEARSCERFEVLTRCSPDRELARFYARLSSCELGHYTVFVRLAGHVLPEEDVGRRWRELLEAEAALIAAQPPGSRMHGGF